MCYGHQIFNQLSEKNISIGIYVNIIFYETLKGSTNLLTPLDWILQHNLAVKEFNGFEDDIIDHEILRLFDVSEYREIYLFLCKRKWKL